MAQNGNGALFTNNRKVKPNHPDYNGNIVLTRELMDAYMKAMGSEKELKVQIAGWKKSMSGGGTYLSLSVSAPYEGERAERSTPIPPRKRIDLDDDSPF